MTILVKSTHQHITSEISLKRMSIDNQNTKSPEILWRIHRERILRKFGVSQYKKSKEVAQKCEKKLLTAIETHGNIKSRKHSKLHKDEWGSLCYMNPYSHIPLVEVLLSTIESYAIPTTSMHMITVIEKNWETNSVKFEFNARKITKELRKGLKGLNYIGLIEFAYFRKKDLIAPHFHGLIWGELTKDREDQLNALFSGGRKGAKGFVAKKVYNLVGALAYCTKPLYHGYKMPQSDDEDSDTGYQRQTDYITLDKHYILYSHLEKYTYKELCVCGGKNGNSVKKRLFNTLNRIKDHSLSWYEKSAFIETQHIS